MNDQNYQYEPIDLRFGWICQNQAVGAYSRAKLPPNPDESCHSFHFKAATDSGEVCHPLEV
jgi:hypothetical protein